jgi:hypothetical protein
MFKTKLSIISFILLLSLSVFLAMEMTESQPTFLKFYLIFIPFLIFIVFEFYLLHKIKTSNKNKRIYKLLVFFISPLSLLFFLFFSFGESKNKICISGDCENGYGQALYIKSENTKIDANESIKGKKIYYSPEFLGCNWFNNIVWYDGNPYTQIYKGEFKNGYFHGTGLQISFTYDYIKNHEFDENFKFIDGIYYLEGEWEKGLLLWDRGSRSNGHVYMNQQIKNILKDFKIDNKGYYHGKYPD